MLVRPLVPSQAEATLEQLDSYPQEPEVHRYLHSRMMAFDLETLYELHYLAITLGKVRAWAAAVHMRCTGGVCPRLRQYSP